MLALLLVGLAAADPVEELAAQLLREVQADCLLYRRPTRRELAVCMTRTEVPELQQAAWAHILTELAPELGLVSDGSPVIVVRPGAGISSGPWVPVYNNGDTEDGVVSARANLGLFAGWKHVEIEVDPRAGFDVGPVSAGADVHTARMTLAWRSLSLDLGQRPRWYGPERASSLTWTDNAKPLPGAMARAEGRLPGWADKLGRFGIDVGMGAIPGERRDADWPGWLIMDIRWAVVPWFELAATRTSVFGGYDNGEPLPLDWGEVILPLRPHTTDDPERVTADTDERIFLDLRVTLPLRRWLDIPIDYVEGYYQYAGENVYITDSDVLPLPFIQGVASVGGGEVMIRPLFFGAERAIVEDDYHRWYTGHRVYHDGWTRDERSMGFGWGGDAWYWTGWAGLAGAGPWVARASYTHVRKWQVPDVVGDHIFVFPGPERYDLGGLQIHRHIDSVGWLGAELTAGMLENQDFVLDNDAFMWRVAVGWRRGPTAIPGL